MPAGEKTDHCAGWPASLHLVYKHTSARTVLASKKHCGPLMVQKPFYPEANGCCHTYLIHPPAGIVGGDRLFVSAVINKNAHALITAPGAGKFYRSDGRVARQTQIIDLQENALLEWLPQETVYFNHARADSIIRINAHQTSRFMAWEIQCLGLPASEEFFTSGQCLQKLQIWHGHTPVLLETSRLAGDGKLLSAGWGMRGRQAMGTLIMSDHRNNIKRSLIQELARSHQAIPLGFTSTRGLFIVRAMSFYARAIKNLFISIWQRLRPVVLGFEASPPRIWNT